MAYATASDLERRMRQAFSDLYDDGTETDTADTSLADEDLAMVSAEIDSFVGVRYRTPVESEAALSALKAWALTLAEELAYGRARPDAIPERLIARVAAVREQLKAIAENRLTLSGAEDVAVSGFVSPGLVETPDPVFPIDGGL